MRCKRSTRTTLFFLRDELLHEPLVAGRGSIGRKLPGDRGKQRQGFEGEHLAEVARLLN